MATANPNDPTGGPRFPLFRQFAAMAFTLAMPLLEKLLESLFDRVFPSETTPKNGVPNAGPDPNRAGIASGDDPKQTP